MKEGSYQIYNNSSDSDREDSAQVQLNKMQIQCKDENRRKLKEVKNLD